MNKILLSIVVPCLNEKKTIKKVILDIKRNLSKYHVNNYEIIIADNGSTDGTLDILKKEKTIRLIKVPVRGYGAALHSGIVNSKGLYVIYADADLSYPFSNLILFRDTIKMNPDLVLGSRIKGKIVNGAMPFLHRYFGTPILTYLIRIFYRIKTTDCNSGMRMVKKSFYKQLNMRNSGMEWASELLLKTAINKGKYIEVPILFLKDKRERSPHLSTWSDGWRHLKAIILLRPQSLYLVLAILFLSSIYFYQFNFALTFLCLNLLVVLALSLLTLNLLGSIINKRESKLSNFLLNFKLVPITMLISIAVGLSIMFIPDDRLGTKLFLVSVLGVIFMWIFLVETIKTHLVNKLPDE